MKKRLFSLALASVMVLSLAGCGGSKGAATETKAETTEAAADTAKAEGASEETESGKASGTGVQGAAHCMGFQGYGAGGRQHRLYLERIYHDRA